MKAMSRLRLRDRILLLMSATILLTCAVYTFVLVRNRRDAILEAVDAKLLTAARAADDILPEGYHDQITGPDSVSPETYRDIVETFNDLCVSLGLEYIWSVQFEEGKVRFTSATSPDKDVGNLRHAAFYEQHRDPEAFSQALRNMAPTFSSFHNEWGHGRMVLIPRRDGQGRVYMLGASVRLGDLDTLIHTAIREGLLVGLFVALVGALVSAILSRSISRPLRKITNVAEHMARGELDYPVDVAGAKELAALSRSFATMRDAIRDKIASLRQSEENLAITLNSIGDAVVATDAGGAVTRMNPVAENLTGWPAGDAVGRHVKEIMRLVNAQSRERIACPVEKVLKSGHTVGLANHTVLIARDGSEYQIADSGAPICDADGKVVGVVLVFRDVTEEYSLQEQLRQAQKMEAVGQLAGGIAHDFNNLLMGISGHTELLRMRIHEAEDVELLDNVLHATERAAELTRQLLAFSRRGHLQNVAVDVHTVIGDVTNLLSHSIDRSIELTQMLRAKWHVVQGDPSQLESALLNLALNARDAMPQGGEITISTKNLSIDGPEPAGMGEALSAGDYISVSVSDTGIGMNEDQQRRIFEPFFTTKKDEGGTGLGLAGVYGCVRSHHGEIKVDSEVGKGSTFTILLPLARKQRPESGEPTPKPLERGEGRILVADDDPVVNAFLSRSLHELGYTVSACRDGQDAVDLYRRQGKDIGLVILDLIMPHMGGVETFHELKKIDPNVRVLFASGYIHKGTVSYLIEEGALGFLSKPFRLSELTEAVKSHMRAGEDKEGGRDREDN